MGKALVIKGADFFQNSILRNLINPSELEQGKYIDAIGDITPAGSEQVDRYAISGYIPVRGDIYCPTQGPTDSSDSAAFGGYLVYNENKVRIRFNRRRTCKYTYQEGDAFVRFPLRNDYLNNPDKTSGISYPAHFAAYADEAEPYEPYDG